MWRVAIVPDLYVSPDDYLALEAEAEEKSEYLDGIIYAMPGATPLHNLIVANVIRELGNRLRGTPCRAYASDLKVTTPNGRRFFYPDVSVICGSPILADHRRDVVTNPTVVVEVLSERTAAYDRGAKFLAYQSVPHLQEYVLVAQDECRVECYRRQGSGWFYTRVEDRQASLCLDSIKVELSLVEIYSDTQQSLLAR
jgi:Uma2 family endonuclease